MLRLVFAFVVRQGVHEITAILGPLLPSITTDVETCHPLWSCHRRTGTDQSIGSCWDCHLPAPAAVANAGGSLGTVSLSRRETSRSECVGTADRDST